MAEEMMRLFCNMKSSQQQVKLSCVRKGLHYKLFPHLSDVKKSHLFTDVICRKKKKQQKLVLKLLKLKGLLAFKGVA